MIQQSALRLDSQYANIRVFVEHEPYHFIHKHVCIEILNALWMERAIQAIKFHHEVNNHFHGHKEMVFVGAFDVRGGNVLPKYIPKNSNFICVF